MKYLKQLWSYRQTIITLSINDWKREYTETLFGVFWAIFKPLVQIITIWFVFTYAFNRGEVDGFPFIVWYIAAAAPWFFISESLSRGPNSIEAYSVLVTTIRFPIMSLPIIQILSRLYTHFIFLIILVIIFLINGYYPTIYWLNLIYYVFAMVMLMTGINLILSALGVVIKDTKQMIVAITMPLFWFTPILYSLYDLPYKIQIIIMAINPFTYIVSGFRESLLYDVWFWENIAYDIYFWIICGLLIFIGIRIQKFLRPVMADLI